MEGDPRHTPPPPRSYRGAGGTSQGGGPCGREVSPIKVSVKSPPASHRGDRSPAAAIPATAAGSPSSAHPVPALRPPPSAAHPSIPASSILHPCIPHPSCSIPHPPSFPPPGLTCLRSLRNPVFLLQPLVCHRCPRHGAGRAARPGPAWAAAAPPVPPAAPAAAAGEGRKRLRREQRSVSGGAGPGGPAAGSAPSSQMMSAGFFFYYFFFFSSLPFSLIFFFFSPAGCVPGTAARGDALASAPMGDTHTHIPPPGLSFPRRGGIDEHRDGGGVAPRKGG